MDDGRRKHALEHKREKLSKTLTGEKKAKKGTSHSSLIKNFSTSLLQRDIQGFRQKNFISYF